jgi:hypothetical protein
MTPTARSVGSTRYKKTQKVKSFFFHPVSEPVAPVSCSRLTACSANRKAGVLHSLPDRCINLNSASGIEANVIYNAEDAVNVE